VGLNQTTSLVVVATLLLNTGLKERTLLKGIWSVILRSSLNTSEIYNWACGFYRNKFVQKIEKLYIFEKPLTMPFQICKNFCNILNNLIFNQDKLKMCKFPLTGCLQKKLNFFRKKLNFIKIWQVEVGQNKDLVCYRKKQSFTQCAWWLRQLVLKPGFKPKGRALGM